MNPLVITCSTTIGGALLLAIVFRRSQRSEVMGGALGGIAGLIGPQISMAPLGYCAFDSEHAFFFQVHFLRHVTALNAAVLWALLLVVFGTGAVILVLNELHWRYLRTGRVLPSTERSSHFFKGWRWLPWLLLAPTLILVFFLSLLPALQTLSLATRLSRLGIGFTIPVCLDNFAQLIAGPRENAEYYVLSEGYFFRAMNVDYFSTVGVSVFFAVSIVFLANSVGLIIAYAASQKLRGVNVYRALLIWPSALSPVVTGTVFVLIFSQRLGLGNVLLARLGFPEIAWQQSPYLAPWMITLAGTWNILGFNVLFYIAGMQNVPNDILEAASVDGANALQRFRHVTVPMISPIILFVIFNNLLFAFFELFGLIDRLTRGGPMNATSNMIYEIYTLGIVNRDLGKAAAQSIVLMAVVVLLTVLQFRFAKHRVKHQS